MRLRTAASSVLAAALVGLALAPSATAAPPAPDATPIDSAAADAYDVWRLAGANRYDTAVAVSEVYPDGAPAVFIASGEGFPDALSAAAAAAYLSSPLLLTRRDALPENAVAEIARHRPQTIVVVGGEGTISNAVLDQLSALAPEVHRVAGPNRYATSLAVAEAVFGDTGAAYVASGRDFPDALAATGAAGAVDAPVVLVDGQSNAPTSETVAALDLLGVETVYIAGAAGSVTPAFETALQTAGFTTDRRGGADRYATAVAVNRDFENTRVSAVFLAGGADFPDALAAGALAGTFGAPLYLTRQQCAPLPVVEAITSITSLGHIAVGGTASISDNAATLGAC
ncbi:cell wall-binding repeat-containing protein [Microbacterium sp. No. 7]|uniref:cell wall-binding repeat-containing protein n=1 Tax=Microbacterium sp. No. 7 TaxID=1714373 RepID=UPI0006CFAE8C|nr:cell wall-binding repeat-containing protein [Microbacterium sp. No. 7]